MASENPEVHNNDNKPNLARDCIHEFPKWVDLKKVDAATEKLSPFLLQCIRDDINNNPYDTRKRHPVQDSMRI